jgi:hypothetical protein
LSTGLKVHANQNESFILCSTDRQGKGEDPKRPIRPKDLFTTFLKDTAKTLPSSSSSSLLDKSGHNSTSASTTPDQKITNFDGYPKTQNQASNQQNLKKDNLTIDIYKSSQASKLQNDTPEHEISEQNTIWDRKHRRMFQRINSGIERHRNERMRFLTLTTVSEPRKDIRPAWGCMVGRIRRLTPLKLIKRGYLTIEEAKYFYGHGNLNKPLIIDYYKVETAEGQHGVYHVPCFGSYIPQAWLSDNWEQITGARIVDIRICKRGVYNAQRLTHYVITQYLEGQDAIVHCSWGWNWCFKGFVGVWHFLWKHCDYNTVIARWRALLSGKEISLRHHKGRYRISMSGVFQLVSGRWIDIKVIKKSRKFNYSAWKRKTVDLSSFDQAKEVSKNAS